MNVVPAIAEVMPEHMFARNVGPGLECQCGVIAIEKRAYAYHIAEAQVQKIIELQEEAK